MIHNVNDVLQLSPQSLKRTNHLLVCRLGNQRSLLAQMPTQKDLHPLGT